MNGEWDKRFNSARGWVIGVALVVILLLWLIRH
jgi:hypothetical protein